MVTYRSAIDEIETKVRVLRREFTSVHDYNPIEHVSSRLKGLDSLHRKAESRGLNSLAEIKDNLTDIAGVRITCSVSYTHLDVYKRQSWRCSWPPSTTPPATANPPRCCCWASPTWGGSLSLIHI